MIDKLYYENKRLEDGNIEDLKWERLEQKILNDEETFNYVAEGYIATVCFEEGLKKENPDGTFSDPELKLTRKSFLEYGVDLLLLEEEAAHTRAWEDEPTRWDKDKRSYEDCRRFKSCDQCPWDKKPGCQLIGMDSDGRRGL